MCMAHFDITMYASIDLYHHKREDVYATIENLYQASTLNV